MKVLFVCLGNICRSPTAEGVLRSLAQRQGVDVTVESAGTAAFHIGKTPDKRSQEAALQRGINIASLSARQVKVDDFYGFDFIFAMDLDNLMGLQAICPDDAHAHLSLFLKEFGALGEVDVPDPYYGGSEGFERVLDLLEDACAHFIKRKVLKNRES